MRTVAVMLVVLDHLYGWPRGGFVGVDVFFVISGFLITGLLLREFDRTGRISFVKFYERRVRRIVPVATLVLVLTCLASYAAFSVTRASGIRTDAVWALLFAANWRFGSVGTDYFASDTPPSPLQHYWSLSIEEQFYFVWPALILIIGLVVARRSWSSAVRRNLTAAVMGTIVVASFAWALTESANNPTWAYFSTFTRVWELGLGALVAICAGAFAKIPATARPFIAWTGLLAIAGGALLITENAGFPAPAAAIPVLGTAVVIAAGVGGETKYLQPITNKVSVYVGDISYSVYLWHWPIIILLGSQMEVGGYYYVAALALTFGLSVGSYHLFEDPIRKSSWPRLAPAKRKPRSSNKSKSSSQRKPMARSTQLASVGAAVLVTVGLASYAIRPAEPAAVLPDNVVASAVSEIDSPSAGATVGPEQAALTQEINDAATAQQWPELSPSMDEAMARETLRPEVGKCGIVTAGITTTGCVYGDPSAPISTVLVGDSTAQAYGQGLIKMANDSGGQMSVRLFATSGCSFLDADIKAPNEAIQTGCPGRNAKAIAAINELRPSIVFVTNSYNPRAFMSTSEQQSQEQRAESLSRFVTQFSPNVGKVVFLSPIPLHKDVNECYTPQSVPADCLGQVPTKYKQMAAVDDQVATQVGGLRADALPWYCTSTGYCPAFVGTLPTKVDSAHTSPEYAERIAPVMGEYLSNIGVLR
ncbi:acyltransferase family protein [Rhodococcus sp. NBC_00294]|uniref:acyltransferase family protein n=1 Tax=Rhodococcus sp. NBC_00294 TaxID=2976004 RepID=UPI002E2E1C1E|nr:acyltransferase family protein [Rhodococcus sp. NBC_00294]